MTPIKENLTPPAVHTLEELRKAYRSDLKDILLQLTNCDVQHTGWTCGTCFYNISENLTNRHWQLVLLIRGDYNLSDFTDTLPIHDYTQLSKETHELLTFLRLKQKQHELSNGN